MQQVPCPAVSRPVHRVLLLFLSIGLFLYACSTEPAVRASQNGPMLSAAASLNRVLPPLIATFEQAHGAADITVNYGSSGALRQQIQSGAPVDAVLFASEFDVDQLIEQGLAERNTRRVVARNEILLVGPEGDPPHTFHTLKDLDPRTRLAIGAPGFVPAGRYARQALEQAGAWASLQGQLVYGGDVTRVVSYARRGEVDLAVVYRTDVLGVDGLEVLDRSNWEGAPRPVVVAASTVLGAGNDVIRNFLAFLQSPSARALWSEHGFLLP